MNFKHKNTNIEIAQTKVFSKNLTVLFSFGDKLLKDSSAYSATKLFSAYDNSTDKASVIAHYTDKPHIIVNLGNRQKLSFSTYTNLLAELARTIKNNHKIKVIDIVIEDSLATALKQEFNYYLEQTVFNLINNLYLFDDFKLTKTKLSLQKINLISKKTITSAISSSISLLEGVYLIKDLGNNPANVATPTHFADIAEKIAKESKKVDIKIIDEKEARKLKMLSFLSVSQGSKEEAKMITMSYKGGKSTDKPIVLVGKGVTFDSGGISIKPSANMESMKYDMMGAATVLGIFLTVIKLQLQLNLSIVVPCTENMPSGTATKPGDIIKSMSGQTIEIINTDAEGRLILCDALTYAKRYKPELVIDMATLTGACVIALGNICSGMYSNDDKLAENLYSSGLKVNDKVWRMPLFDEYLDSLKNGTVADLSNISPSGGGAGSVTAAKFLETFTDYKWVHLDIAGSAMPAKGGFNGLNEGGATGRPFYMMMDFLRNYKK